MELIEDADYDARKTEILKVVASVLLDHPMLLAASDSESIKRNVSTTISLAEKEGVEMSKRDYVEALKLLGKTFSFGEIINEKSRGMFYSKSTIAP